MHTGAVLEGFLRFPETTQDFLSTMGAALFGYNVSRGIHSGLNSGVNRPLFHLLVKEMQWRPFIFRRHEGKLETFAKICVVASLETLHEDPTVRIRDKQAAWKLLSKISRTAPGCTCVYIKEIQWSHSHWLGEAGLFSLVLSRLMYALPVWGPLLYISVWHSVSLT